MTGTPAASLLRRIGDVAEATGLTPRTIRYYEEVGLLKPAAHVSGANRRYDDEDLERLRLIKRLREVVGLSLSDVHTFLETETERRQKKHRAFQHADQLQRFSFVPPRDFRAHLADTGLRLLCPDAFGLKEWKLHFRRLQLDSRR